MSAPITTKIFKHGGSQAARIPMDFRFPANVIDVQIRRDSLTGHLVLSPMPAGWTERFAFLDQLATPDAESAQLRLQLEGSGP